MVEITNGVKRAVVPRGAFESHFKKLGYEIMDKHSEAEEEASVEKVDENEQFVSDLLEKPIAEWNKEEIKRFAAIKDVDISGTKNANEARDIVRNYLNENQ